MWPLFQGKMYTEFFLTVAEFVPIFKSMQFRYFQIVSIFLHESTD